MSSVKNLAQVVFKSSLEAVRSDKLTVNALQRTGDMLRVGGHEYQLQNNVKVIGFGKAVYGMAVGVLKVIDDHVTNGLLSVPYGSTSLNQSALPSKICVLEGARNNLPDEHSSHNAEEIERFVRGDVTQVDILMVLISGGGSALLSSPVKEITLSEKLETIKLIANNGGDIQQLNTMRKNLSRLKGGKLGVLSPTNSVISLIISDIVGDPLDLIASGPTVFDQSTSTDCLNILNDLGVLEKAPKSVLTYLKNRTPDRITGDMLKHCINVLVGNNSMALSCASKVASSYGFKPFILSSCAVGNAQVFGEKIAEFALNIVEGKFKDCLGLLAKDLKIREMAVTEKDSNETSRLCFILGGETTVQVRGTGKGGRNQHMVLSALGYLKKAVVRNPEINLTGITFLSAGTDGQDGPTDATGAFLDHELLSHCIDKDIDGFLRNCGSYDFFTSSNFALRYLLKTGLTGINVMDMQLLFVDRTQDLKK